MKLSTQAFVLFSLLPVITQALPAAGSAGASRNSGNGDGNRANDVEAANSHGNGGNNNQATANVENENNNNNANGNDNGNNSDNNANNTAANAVNPNHAPSEQQIANAVDSWMNDTGKVTYFLNTATSFSGDEFTREATIALNAEIDELNHKKVLDDALLAQDESVKAANEVLDTQGNFQAVVDVLQSMVDNGPDNAQAQVNEINQNRCVNVLPNIDAYFAAAGSATVSAVRPTGCLEVEGASVTSAGADVTAASAEITDAPSGSATETGVEGESASATKGAGAAANTSATKGAGADEEDEAEDDQEDEDDMN